MIRLRPSGVDEILIKRVQDWYEPGPGVFIQSLTASFSPAMLFTGSTTGVWYDPSDTTTLFQDAAGTTPVTTVEQPVGLMLDKSKGLVLGPELVTNGDFSNGTAGWLATGCSQAVLNGENTITATGTQFPSVYEPITCAVGKTYILTAIARKGSGASSVGVQINGVGGAYTSSTSNSALRYQFVASQTAYTVAAVINGATAAGDTATFDNISVRELPGNHAFNSSGNSANFPVLSARYNLLTKTEQFDDAVWTKAQSSISGNTSATTDPLGGNTADKITENTNNSTHGVYNAVAVQTPNGISYTWTIYAKAAERSWLRLDAYTSPTVTGNVWFDLQNGVVGTTAAGATASIRSVGGGWYECKVTRTSTQVSSIADGFLGAYIASADNATSYTGDGTSGIYIWGADLRVANDALGQPAYQRVNTATDYDTVGFKPYLRFNGTNQWLQTNSIDFTYGDKMFVSAGVRKLSDAALGVIQELGNGSQSNVFGLWNGDPAVAAGARYAYVSGGTVGVSVGSPLSYASPITNVISGIGNISAPSATLRVNGAQVAQSTASQGTGNYGNYPLYIGARAGTSLWFNGRLYQMVVAGKQASAAEITSTETYLNQKTGAY